MVKKWKMSIVNPHVHVTAIVDKLGKGKKDIKMAAEGTRCIPETEEGVGSQRNSRENQSKPVQDFNSTSPAIWLKNMEDYKDR